MSSEVNEYLPHFRSAWDVSYYIMKLLKPGTLEEIELIDNCNIAICDEMTELDQWKHAKILKVDGYKYFTNWTENFSNFVRFDIKVFVFRMSELVELKNTALESANFEKCRLESDIILHNGEDDDDDEVLNFNAAERAFGPLIRKDSKDPNYRQYVIEHKNKVFEFKIGQQSIEIERKR